MELKVVSTVINPIPDEEGFHIFECEECHFNFLINPHDIGQDKTFYCPHCGHEGSFMSFTQNIRQKLFKDHPLNIPQDDLIKVTENDDNIPLDIEDIKDLLKNMNQDTVDVEVLQYTINEVIPDDEFTKYEFICCDKNIKVKMDDYQKVHFCPLCKGEILLNISE